MSQYSDKNILDSNAHYLFFAASSALTPKHIHGNKDVAPLQEMSALANALYEHDNRLATTVASQLVKARQTFHERRRMPLMFIRLDDNRVVCPFIVRRHVHDQVDNALVILTASMLFERIMAEMLAGAVYHYAIERPIDADETYDRIMALLPKNVTIHKEIRHAENKS